MAKRKRAAPAQEDTVRGRKRRGNETDEGLTHYREEFLRFYCGEARFNATRALRLAANDPTLSRQQASFMLNSRWVQEALAKRVFEMRECSHHIFLDIVKTELDIIKTSPFDVIDPRTGAIKDKISKRTKNAVAEINVKEYEGGRSIRVKTYDKGASISRLSKILGLITEQDKDAQEREQIRDADTTISGRIGGLRARLVPRSDSPGPGEDGGGAKSPPL